jgi:sugar phosphate isomerase/epimerase
MTGPLSLAAGALPEFSAETVADAAGRAGFSLVGFTVDPATWSGETTRRVRAQLAEWNLAVLDVEVAWIPAGGVVTDGHRRIIDVGAELGARNLLVVSSEPDVRRTAAALHQLCERAEPAGIRVALEFLMITRIRTLHQALAVVSRCDHPAAAVLVDALHLQRAGEAPAELVGVDPRLLPYAQLCDGRARCAEGHEHYMEDALDLRCCPGEGELPLAELLAVLPGRCPLSLEIRSRAWRERFPDAVRRATALRSSTLEYLNTLPARPEHERG